MEKLDKMNSSDNNEDGSSRFARQWHYRPTVPILTSPLFQWPPQPRQMGRWFADRWFTFGENLIIVALAVLVWHVFEKPLAGLQTFEAKWFGLVFVRNAVLMTIVAGGLHLLLYIRRSQGKELKFDPRDFVHKGKVFTFNNQVLDNMFWTLGSGVFFWTVYECLMLWAMANGYSPVLHWADNPVWFVLLFLLTPMWISFHFYWIHRLLHWPPLYKLAHALHHRNTNIGPWSGFSMHPIEHILFLSSVLIHWIVAAHPIHILFHLQHQALTAATSHTGFDALLVKNKKSIELGNFHHQMHHRYFDCNYGNLEIPWDKVFNSYHDGTELSHSRFLEKRRSRLGNT